MQDKLFLDLIERINPFFLRSALAHMCRFVRGGVMDCDPEEHGGGVVFPDEETRQAYEFLLSLQSILYYNYGLSVWADIYHVFG